MATGFAAAAASRIRVMDSTAEAVGSIVVEEDLIAVVADSGAVVFAAEDAKLPIELS